jgi:nitrite reductase/ring-hydroxylating ferredoxin subunit
MPEAWTLRRQHQAQVATSLGVLAAGIALAAAVFAFVAAFASPDNPDHHLVIHAGRLQSFIVEEPQFFTQGKFWLVRQPDDTFLALYAKDPNRGCTVPWRPTFSFRDPRSGESRTGWFRNPCHGQTYDLQGRCVFGPCVRGLDRYPVEVRGSSVWVDTRRLINGPPLGER